MTTLFLKRLAGSIENGAKSKIIRRHVVFFSVAILF